MKFVLLAAGKSKRIYNKIKKNKCLLKIRNKTIIQNSLDHALKSNIRDLFVVVGFNANKIKLHLKKNKKIRYIYNSKFNSSEMMYSLILALKKINDDIIFGYSDVLISQKVLKKIIKFNSRNITIPILSNWKKIWKIRDKNPYDDAETLIIKKNSDLSSIGKKIKKLKEIKYQFMGIVYIPKNKRNYILNFYAKIKNKKNLHLTTFINKLLKKKVKVQSIKVADNWYEFDDYQDYINYKKYFLK